MILYVISKNRYYLQAWLHFGFNNHFDFAGVPQLAKFFDKKESADRMCEELNKHYEGWLDNYKGKFRVRTFKFEEVK